MIVKIMSLVAAFDLFTESFRQAVNALTGTANLRSGQGSFSKLYLSLRPLSADCSRSPESVDKGSVGSANLTAVRGGLQRQGIFVPNST